MGLYNFLFYRNFSFSLRFWVYIHFLILVTFLYCTEQVNRSGFSIKFSASLSACSPSPPHLTDCIWNQGEYFVIESIEYYWQKECEWLIFIFLLQDTKHQYFFPFFVQIFLLAWTCQGCPPCWDRQGCSLRKGFKTNILHEHSTT